MHPLRDSNHASLVTVGGYQSGCRDEGCQGQVARNPGLLSETDDMVSVGSYGLSEHVVEQRACRLCSVSRHVLPITKTCRGLMKCSLPNQVVEDGLCFLHTIAVTGYQVAEYG